MATALNQEVYEVLLEVCKKFRGGSIKQLMSKSIV